VRAWEALVRCVRSCHPPRAAPSNITGRHRRLGTELHVDVLEMLLDNAPADV
jgi:hypothetical protein